MVGTEAQHFSLEVVGDYIHLKTMGAPEMKNVEEPVNAALALAAETHTEKLLDDIREVDASAVSIPIQAKAMGLLWKLRSFKKVAMVMNESRIRTLFFSTLDVLKLDKDIKFKGFDNEAEAIDWLRTP